MALQAFRRSARNETVSRNSPERLSMSAHGLPLRLLLPVCRMPFVNGPPDQPSLVALFLIDFGTFGIHDCVSSHVRTMQILSSDAVAFFIAF